MTLAQVDGDGTGEGGVVEGDTPVGGMGAGATGAPGVEFAGDATRGAGVDTVMGGRTAAAIWSGTSSSMKPLITVPAGSCALVPVMK